MKHKHRTTAEVVDVRDRSETDVAFVDATGERHMSPDEFDAMYTPIPLSTLVAQAIMNGHSSLNTTYGCKSLAGVERMILSTHPLDVLEKAASFIAGFEGDELQEGVDELLRELRAAIEQINN